MGKAKILTVAMLVTAMGLRAQGGSSKMRIKLELMPLQSIQIDDGAKGENGEPGDAVNLLYSGSDSYTNGVARRVGGRLRAVSVSGSGGYTVSAIFRGDFQKGTGKASENVAVDGQMPPTTERPDVESPRSAMDAEGNRELDLMYSIAPN